jgi:hypothetical protein
MSEAICGDRIPGVAALARATIIHQHIVYDCGAAAIFRAANFHAREKIFADYQP